MVCKFTGHQNLASIAQGGLRERTANPSPVILSEAKDLKTPVSDKKHSACRKSVL